MTPIYFPKREKKKKRKRKKERKRKTVALGGTCS